MYVDTLGMHENFHFSPFEFTGSTLKISATPTNNDLIPPARPPENDPSWQPRDYSEYRYNGPTAEAAGYVAEDVGYLSGIITSYDSFKTTHGYFEMRAKLPAGKGLWPAFWLLNAHYVEDVPEIDVMEFLGGDLSKLYNTYHYFDIQDDWRKVSTPSYEVIGENWTQNFHTFGLGWSPTEIIWYVDGQETNRVDSSEFKISGQAMYLVANLAVGGNWAGEPDSSTSFPAVFEIDYIRAYKKELQQPPNLNVDYQLVFEDEFDGAELDRSKWNTHFLWGPYLAINNEEQYYVDALGIDSPDAENSPFSLSEGILKITGREASSQDSFPVPLTQPSDDDAIWDEYPSYQRSLSYKPATYTSGLITSYDSFKFTHGYVDIRAKLPKGDGLWPAFWLLNSYYISQQPEIDIMEFRGRLPNEIVHSYHRLEGGQTITNSFTTNLGIDLSADYHDFGVSWEPGILQWFLDGVLVGTYESPDVGYQLMYLIANLAIGGDFDPNVDVDISKFPATLEIDHIKVYQAK